MIPLALWGAAPEYTPRDPDLSIRVRSPDGIADTTKRALYARNEAAYQHGIASRRVDLTGRVFDDLTALERDEVKLKGYWRCRCVCTRIVSRTSDYLQGQGGKPRGRLRCGRGCPGESR